MGFNDFLLGRDGAVSALQEHGDEDEDAIEGHIGAASIAIHNDEDEEHEEEEDDSCGEENHYGSQEIQFHYFQGAQEDSSVGTTCFDLNSDFYAPS